MTDIEPLTQDEYVSALLSTVPSTTEEAADGLDA
jgi:hypothetical protein